MTKPGSTVRQSLRDAFADGVRRAIEAGSLTVAHDADLPALSIERPARPEHGDYATNAAMQLAPVARMAPMKIAAALLEVLELPDGMGTAEVAPPGFINVRLDPAWVGGQVAAILDAGDSYGRVAA